MYPFARMIAPLLVLAAFALPTLALTRDQPRFTPALAHDFPDPFVIETDGGFLAYSTNSDRHTNVPMARSRDLIEWELVRNPARRSRLLDAMPRLPSWAKRGFTWAPEVLRTDAGYLLYFTTRHARTDQQCVGVAFSKKALGPFVSRAPEPLVCQHALGGTIDASPFRDADGQLYLYFKNDGNHPSARKPSEIWGQRLSPDGMRLVGEPVSILRNDKPWEGHVVEAPTMVRTDGGYTMLFSANDYGWQPSQPLSVYALGYASCRSPLGPCIDAEDNPILSSNVTSHGCLSGPGHQAVFEARGRRYIAFHAWAATSNCRRSEGGRYLYVAPLDLNGGKPVIGSSLRRAPVREK